MKRTLLTLAAVAGMSSVALAQPPGGGPGGPRGGGPGGPGGGQRSGSATSVTDLVARMMKFDANKDDSLSKAELTDERLQPMFDRADADHDGVATKQELTALFTKENAALGSNRNGPMGGPPGGEGRPPMGQGREAGSRVGSDGGDNRRPGGPDDGPPGEGFGGPPRPGQILHGRILEDLNLTAAQKKQIAELQKLVDGRLEKILTAEQKQRLQEMGPPPGGGPGGPPGGFGGQGDGPPRGPREGGTRTNEGPAPR